MATSHDNSTDRRLTGWKLKLQSQIIHFSSMDDQIALIKIRNDETEENISWRPHLVNKLAERTVQKFKKNGLSSSSKHARAELRITEAIIFTQSQKITPILLLPPPSTQKKLISRYSPSLYFIYELQERCYYILLILVLFFGSGFIRRWAADVGAV